MELPKNYNWTFWKRMFKIYQNVLFVTCWERWITGVGELAGKLFDKFGTSFIGLERSTASWQVGADIQGPGRRWLRQVTAAVRRRGVLGAVPFLLLILLSTMMCLVVEVFRRRRCRYAALFFLVSLYGVYARYATSAKIKITVQVIKSSRLASNTNNTCRRNVIKSQSGPIFPA